MSGHIRVGGEPNLVIDAMYAYVAQGPDGEGVMGASIPIQGQMMMMPLVGADIQRIASLYPYAKKISEETGRPFRIYKFSDKRDVTDEIAGLMKK